MAWLETIVVGGFWFFLIKGMMWLILFGLAYMGFINKETLAKIRNRIRFRKNK